MKYMITLNPNLRLSSGICTDLIERFRMNRFVRDKNKSGCLTWCLNLLKYGKYVASGSALDEWSAVRKFPHQLSEK